MLVTFLLKKLVIIKTFDIGFLTFFLSAMKFERELGETCLEQS